MGRTHLKSASIRLTESQRDMIIECLDHALTQEEVELEAGYIEEISVVRDKIHKLNKKTTEDHRNGQNSRT